MFTGLVETIGVVEGKTGGRTARASIGCSMGPLALGESISVNGACLTVDRITPRGFEADMSSETLEKTTLGRLAIGGRVHLERALAIGDRLGGHLVLGHVDGVGEVLALSASGDARRLEVRAPRELARYVAPKGSITVDGASLTVNDVTDAPDHVDFAVMLVPHTIERTLLGSLGRGSRVNLEVDVLARYIARQLECGGAGWRPPQSSPRGAQTNESGHEAQEVRDRELLEKLARGGYL